MGHAAESIEFCEVAVSLTGQNPEVLDSRGLARALTGDIQGAIADFADFVAYTETTGEYETVGQQRVAWITALEKEENPFTPELLTELLNQ